MRSADGLKRHHSAVLNRVIDGVPLEHCDDRFVVQGVRCLSQGSMPPSTTMGRFRTTVKILSVPIFTPRADWNGALWTDGDRTKRRVREHSGGSVAHEARGSDDTPLGRTRVDWRVRTRQRDASTHERIVVPKNPASPWARARPRFGDAFPFSKGRRGGVERKSHATDRRVIDARNNDRQRPHARGRMIGHANSS